MLLLSLVDDPFEAFTHFFQSDHRAFLEHQPLHLVKSPSTGSLLKYDGSHDSSQSVEEFLAEKELPQGVIWRWIWHIDIWKRLLCTSVGLIIESSDSQLGIAHCNVIVPLVVLEVADLKALLVDIDLLGMGVPPSKWLDIESSLLGPSGFLFFHKCFSKK